MDKDLYASYLLNILCNDEKALGLACKIIIYEYKSDRIKIDDKFYCVIIDKLRYEIQKNHDWEIVWLTYLLKYTKCPVEKELLNEIIECQCDLAIIVILEEWPKLINDADIDLCWDKSISWLLLYQIALRYPKKRDDFYIKLNIKHNKNFYDKLFGKGFSFYKSSKLYEYKNTIHNEILQEPLNTFELYKIMTDGEISGQIRNTSEPDKIITDRSSF